MTDQSSANRLNIAETFLELAQKVKKIALPTDKKIQQDIDLKYIAAWSFDSKIATLGSYGDIKSIILKIIIYSRTVNIETASASIASGPCNDKLVEEIDSRIASIRAKLATCNDREKLLQEIKTMEAVKIKLTTKAVEVKNDNDNALTGKQIRTIAKRVFELLQDRDRNTRFYEALKFHSEPKVDKIKERSGGDYVLKNSARDRRFASDDSWFKGSENSEFKQPKSQADTDDKWRNSTPSNGSRQRYVPPTSNEFDSYPKQSGGSNNTLTSKPNPTRYVPPSSRESNNDTTSSNDVTKFGKSSDQNHYRPPITAQQSQARGYSGRERDYIPDRGNRRDETDRDFVNINDIKRTTNIKSFADFPSLALSNNESTISEQTVFSVNSGIIKGKQIKLLDSNKSDDIGNLGSNPYNILLPGDVNSEYVDSWDNLDKPTETKKSSSNTKHIQSDIGKKEDNVSKKSSFAEIAKLAKEKEDNARKLAEKERIENEQNEKQKRDSEIAERARRDKNTIFRETLQLKRNSTVKIINKEKNTKSSDTDAWDNPDCQAYDDAVCDYDNWMH
jgi:hypothetical protein